MKGRMGCSRRGPGCNGLQCAPDRRNGPPGCSKASVPRAASTGHGHERVCGQALLERTLAGARAVELGNHQHDQKSAKAELNFRSPTFGGQQRRTRSTATSVERGSERALTQCHGERDNCSRADPHGFVKAGLAATTPRCRTGRPRSFRSPPRAIQTGRRSTPRTW